MNVEISKKKEFCSDFYWNCMEFINLLGDNYLIQLKY